MSKKFLCNIGNDTGRLRAVQWLLLANFLLFNGCAPQGTKIVLGQQSTSVYPAGQVNLARNKTFSIFPFPNASTGQTFDPKTEAALTFFLRNQLESKGYVFAEPGQLGDVWITEQLYPAQQSTPTPPPSFTPTTISTVTKGSEPIWGTAPHLNADSFLTSPVQPTFSSYSDAPRTPAAIVAAYDGKTHEQLWYGVGRTDSDSDDPRISGQDAIASALANFPQRPTRKSREPSEPTGAIGVRVGIYTSDGSSYLPVILEFSKVSPARDAGMKPKDRVLSVDGQSLVDMTFIQATRLMHGQAKSPVTLQVQRADQTLSFTVIRVPWTEAWGDTPEE